RGERQPYAEGALACAPDDCDLGHGQRSRLEARPVRRAAAVRGEREASERHGRGALAAGELRVHRLCGELTPPLRDRREARFALRLQAARLAEPGQRSTPAIRLLEDEPWLARAP